MTNLTGKLKIFKDNKFFTHGNWGKLVLPGGRQEKRPKVESQRKIVEAIHLYQTSLPTWRLFNQISIG